LTWLAQNALVFTVDQRDAVRDRILEMARADERVVGAALLGSLALGSGDRWSDLDLSFGVIDGTTPGEVLDNWAPRLERELDAVQLFDLPVQSWVYRVFLFPGALQVDVSVAPAADWAPCGPKFRLLFGTAADLPHSEPPDPGFLFGLGVHHAVRARIFIERGRSWQAEYWISELRHHALELACINRGLEPSEARGFDELPTDVLEAVEDTLVRAAERDELLRALGSAIEALLRESVAVPAVAPKVEAQLRELVAD
jgi:predicted nucleotidyltransferase